MADAPDQIDSFDDPMLLSDEALAKILARVQNESQEPDPDTDLDPEPYLAALDYISMLAGLGFTLVEPKKGTMLRHLPSYYQKEIPPGSNGISAGIAVRPDAEEGKMAAGIMVIYKVEGSLKRVSSIVVPAIDVVDTIQNVERAIAGAQSIEDLTLKLNGLIVHGVIESAEVPQELEQPDPDDPEMDSCALPVDWAGLPT